MTKGRLRENKGPCVICDKDDINKKFRKLTTNLFQEILNSEYHEYHVKLKLYDQLYEKHYNELVVFNRNTLKSSRKPACEIDSAYNERGNKAKQVCLSQESYENLLNDTSNIPQLEQEISELKEKVNNYMRDSEQINGI